jgi:integrase/recombinase XerD
MNELEILIIKYKNYLINVRQISDNSLKHYMSVLNSYSRYIDNDIKMITSNSITHFVKRAKYKSNILKAFLNYFNISTKDKEPSKKKKNKYIEHFRTSDELYLSDKSIKTYCNRIYELFKAIEKNDIQDITREDIKTQLKGSITARRAKLSAYKKFFEFYQINICYGLKIDKRELENNQKKNIAESFLNDDELTKLNRWFSRESKTEDEKINKMACYTAIALGLRLSEVINLKVSSIEESRMFVVGKGNKYRYVEIFQDYYKFVTKYIKEMGLKPNDYIIKNRTVRPFIAESFNNRIRRQFEKLGLRKDRRITFHKLRHTYATILRNDDVEIEYIKEQLGHERIETTLIYAKANDEKKQQKLGKNRTNVSKIL